MILEKIKKPNDIHKIALADFPQLAEEIRRFLIESVSHTGGHLASNLGVVELTLALHNVLDFPEDKLIWDVGHQAYTHKILTGRKDDFKTLRKEGGLSGFPKRKESSCDSFDTGHSSNSVSAGLGYVRARDLLKQKHHVVSVIGDGALTGGMAYEALNNAAELDTNFIIIINDNNMSISQNVGGISTYLSALRTAEVYTGMKLNVTKTLKKIPRVGTAIVDTVRKTKSSIKQLFIPGMLFENMGLTYLGPVDGHNMRQMMKLFNEAKRVEGPVVVHVLTQKGRGYTPACNHPDRFHGTGPFDIKTGKALEEKKESSYTDVFSRAVCRCAEKNKKVVAITAAMPEGTGLKHFSKAFPDRFFDVGIAEEHAVTFGAGLALGGMIPVVAVYSSFLQRAVDQILHDVCMQNLHVIFAVDRAGLVGADGETHHGCFDLSYLTMMPNMTVMAPKNAWELEEMMKFAVNLKGPCAVRYPKGAAYQGLAQYQAPVEKGKSEVLYRGRRIAVLGVGSMTAVCEQVCEGLKGNGYDPTFVNVRFVKPLDTELLDELAADHDLFVTVEENVKNGGYGEHVAAYMEACHRNCRVLPVAIWDRFVEHGSVDSLRAKIGLSAPEIQRAIEEYED
ncbi:MAG: 1-deoxy-D-xylulose-5-phosphate synthase [Eubacteriales bacterium]|nr:1-deoxy-D-xylulose-5-phosphate synthase [Eubacteriales bacterium]